MILRNNVVQLQDQIIDIAHWPVHDEYEVFPVGARDKSLRICPADTNLEFCIPNHKYLFKEAIKSARDSRLNRHPDQYFAEIIAFKIGRLMQLNIPPAFVAINSETGEPGAIIEWFIGYDNDIKERFTPGGDHMQAMIQGYDRKKGRQHNLTSITTFCRGLAQQGKLKTNWKEYWGLCLCFDALIGNTDRHQENWGVIWNESDGTAKLSPYFDNGTSLGHELFHNRLMTYMSDQNALEDYIKRGRHQMKWQLDDDNRLPLIGGVSRYCQKYPSVIPLLLERLLWNNNDLAKILSDLTRFDIKSPLTAKRADFVQNLTTHRKQLLLELLESHQK